MHRHPVTRRIRKPTLATDNLNKDVGVSPRPTAVTIAPVMEDEDEEETAEIKDDSEDHAKGEKPDTTESADDVAEAEPLRAAPSPILPPAAEVEEHRLTHTPFRSWCEFCKLGRGIGEQHRRDATKQRTIPIVGVDYWYIICGNTKKRSELDQAEDEDGELKLMEARKSGTIVKCIVAWW